MKEPDEKATKQVDGKGRPRELRRLDTSLQSKLDGIAQRATHTTGKEDKKNAFIRVVR